MESLSEMIAEYQDHKKMHCHEGSRGVENLCKLVRAIGYRDSMNRMQFRDGCLGDLLEFLEDNSGAIEAVVNWIGDQDIQEWKENLESELPECPHTDVVRDDDGWICQECGVVVKPPT